MNHKNISIKTKETPNSPGHTLKKEINELNSPIKSQIEWTQLVSMSPSHKLKKYKINLKNRFTIEDIEKHNTENDCWIVVKNEVYDISKYLNYHPGGKKILMNFAGKDATEGFNKFHSYINIDRILGSYHVGSIFKTFPSMAPPSPILSAVMQYDLYIF